MVVGLVEHNPQIGREKNPPLLQDYTRQLRAALAEYPNYGWEDTTEQKDEVIS